MAEGVLEHLGESVQQLGPLGLTVGHQEGDESLAVRPPQLHAPLQLVQNGKVRSVYVPLVKGTCVDDDWFTCVGQ